MPEDKAQLFHHLVAKLLYLCRCTRQGIQTVFAFLCTRVKEPDEDDYKKLTKVMQYIRNTKSLTLTIKPSADPKWWVLICSTPRREESYGHNHESRKGATYSGSTKQKLNTKSSTEAELVAIDNAMAQILWTRHFLTAQGEFVPTTTIYQDNKSTILLAENGRQSSSRRTRHLNVQYFFVTDKIKKGEVKVAFCPTHDMLADFFTKPLQGMLFTRMRDKILNLTCSTSPKVHRSVLNIQNFSMNNNAQTIDGHEGDGEVVSPIKKNRNDGTESAPAQINDKPTMARKNLEQPQLKLVHNF